ncbi:tetratricopeptide repeat protein [Bacteroidales bacterium OttesenSCG-928-K03]|nr:tetratricopeptide repeat protein [Bacteroidales bacterium OttesenSCG-928-L14]MDL2240290.1 tetratricopeptide repeat protein [Bacteroidales bacterium OttesenSCG-928-K22]MDL2242996.1 tetratricopeptide repeat protein [Bacteroidales bacterium OttesenSCG-928-K03]
MNIFRILFITIISLIFSSNVYCQKEKTQVRSGNKDFNKGSYHDAEIKYRKALDIKPLMDEAEFNLGNSLYMQENYPEAALSYMAAAGRTDDNKLQASSFYNLGNALFSSQKYAEAVEAYKESLRKNPTDEARYNLEMAKKMLENSGQDQQQDQQEGDDNQESDQNKEQQDSQNQEEQQNNDQSEQQQSEQKETEQGEQGEQQEAREAEISEEDAERILEALKNEEQETMKKILEKQHQGQRSKIDKDW